MHILQTLTVDADDGGHAYDWQCTCGAYRRLIGFTGWREALDAVRESFTDHVDVNA